MYHIKTHYFSSHPNLNFYGIVPAGCGFEDMLKEKHDRARFWIRLWKINILTLKFKI